MGINKYLKIGSNIKERRLSLGWTQKETAKKLGIPYSTYSNYENNNREPSLEILQKISMLFGIPVWELLGLSRDEMVSNAIVYRDFGPGIYDDVEKLKLSKEILQKYENVNYLDSISDYIGLLSSCGLECNGTCCSTLKYEYTFVTYEGKKYKVINDDTVLKRIKLSHEAISKIRENLVTSFELIEDSEK